MHRQAIQLARLRQVVRPTISSVILEGTHLLAAHYLVTGGGYGYRTVKSVVLIGSGFVSVRGLWLPSLALLEARGHACAQQLSSYQCIPTICPSFLLPFRLFPANLVFACTVHPQVRHRRNTVRDIPVEAWT